MGEPFDPHSRTTDELQQCYPGLVTERKQIRLDQRTNAAKVATTTRTEVEAGTAVTWIWRRDSHFKRALVALGGWQPPHFGWWRLEHGQSAALFSPTTSPVELHTSFVKATKREG